MRLLGIVLWLVTVSAVQAFDAHKNFAVSTVATAPSPATSGTSLVVAAGDGVRFPAPPFNAAIYPSNVAPNPSNTEIVRVTDISTDTLTIEREQEGSSARTVTVGDGIAATITAKVVTDLEDQLNTGVFTNGVLILGDASGDPGKLVIARGTLTNSVNVFGYNQRPNHVLDLPGEPGASFLVEPNYDDGSGQNKMEMYWQYLLTNGAPTSVRRPIISQLNRSTGLLTATELCGGDYLSLNLNDGAGTSGEQASGHQIVVLHTNEMRVTGLATNLPTDLTLVGRGATGQVARLQFVDAASSQTFWIGQQPTAIAAVLQMGYGGSNSMFSIYNDGKVGIGTDGPTEMLVVKRNGGFIAVDNSAGVFWGYKLSTGGGEIGGMKAHGGTGEIRIGSADASYFPTLYSAGVEVARWTTAGNLGIKTTVPTSTLHVAGSFAESLAVGGAATLGETNDCYLVNTDAQTITLPTATGKRGRKYEIKLIAPAASGTVNTTSSQLIDGASTYSLSASNKFVTVRADGTNWWIIGNN